MGLAETIKSAAASAAKVAIQAFPNRCDLVVRITTDGGAAGDVEGSEDMASNLRCMYVPRSPAKQQIIVGGVSYIASHDLYIEKTNDSLAITPNYEVRVRATNEKPELIFEQPVIIEDAYDPFVTVAATLVQHG